LAWRRIQLIQLDAGFHSRPSLRHPRRDLNYKNEKPGEYRGENIHRAPSVQNIFYFVRVLQKI
jgi:hypothetical protein